MPGIPAKKRNGRNAEGPETPRPRPFRQLKKSGCPGWNGKKPDWILYFFGKETTIPSGFGPKIAGGVGVHMEIEVTQEQVTSWDEAHPWLSQMPDSEEEDSLDEMIRYALDELRYA